jgi:hypothetical protein
MEAAKLIAELARGGEMIAILGQGFSPEEARQRPAEGAWCLLEVLGHLLEEERHDFRPRLRAALLGLTEPLPPLDTQAALTAGNYLEQRAEALLAQFLNERQRTIAWLETMGEVTWDGVYQAGFGPLRAGDILASWVAHDTLHLRQLVELRYARLRALAAPYAIDYAGEW